MRRLSAHIHPAGAVAAGQAAFLALTGVCLAMRPSRVAVERGLSFYGNELETAIPFALAILVSGALTAYALTRVRAPGRRCRRFRRGTWSIIGLSALIPLTPYSVDTVFDYLHIGLTSVVFTAALAFGLWVSWSLLRHRRAAWAASSTQLASGLLALSAQVGLDDLMIPAQMAFEVAFASLVALGAARLATPAPAHAPAAPFG